MASRPYIGTSGWHYPHWRGPVYPEGLPPAEWLAFYARRFKTVEINSSFYRLPDPDTIEAWRNAVPPGFCFAVKASRLITHMKKLMDPAATVPRLLDRVQGLGPALGPILFQLPPRWHCAPERLAAFLAALPLGHRYAFELRDPSWHTPAVYRLLERAGAAFCVYDLAGVVSPVIATAAFAYVRLHGPDGPYQGSYSRSALRTWARRIRQWRSLEAVFVYFDNDEAGYAVGNASTLRELIQRGEDGRNGGRGRPHP